jgi:hypothetical protein
MTKCDSFGVYYLENDKSLPSSNDVLPGQIIFNKDTLLVKCCNFLLENDKCLYVPYISVKKVKVGNKWMTAKDFQNGFLSKLKQDQKIFVNFQTDAQQNKDNKINIMHS